MSFFVQFLNISEDYWIVYTDYTRSALVYSCGTKNLDGTCQEDSVKIWLLSRHPKMSDFARSYLVSRMRALCVDPQNLVDTPSGTGDICCLEPGPCFIILVINNK